MSAHGETKDRTLEYDYDRLLAEEKAHYSSIEVTDRLREGGLHDGACWRHYWQRIHSRLSATPYASIVEFVEAASDDVPLKVLSLGAGYCGQELDLARGFRRPYEIHCIDINPALFEQARAVAREERLALYFQEADLNHLELEPGSWNMVYANAAIHHVINLEHLFGQVAKGLRPGGVFHVVEVVGRNRSLLWEDSERFVNGLLGLLPGDLTQGARVHVSEGGGMEGVRQEEIDGLLQEYFTPVFELRHGAFARFLCTIDPSLAQRLDPTDPRRRAWLDFLFDADDAAVRRGLLKPLELWAIYAGR